MYGTSPDPIEYTEEYYRRCRENVEACERIGGKPLSQSDLNWIASAVLSQMKAEIKMLKKQKYRKR